MPLRNKHCLKIESAFFRRQVYGMVRFYSKKFEVVTCNSKLDNLFLPITVVLLYSGTDRGYWDEQSLYKWEKQEKWMTERDKMASRQSDRESNAGGLQMHKQKAELLVLLIGYTANRRSTRVVQGIYDYLEETNMIPLPLNIVHFR